MLIDRFFDAPEKFCEIYMRGLVASQNNTAGEFFFSVQMCVCGIGKGGIIVYIDNYVCMC